MFLIFDTETTGLPRDYNAPLTDFDNWPRVVQIAWQQHDINGILLSSGNFLVKPEGFVIPYNAEKIHGISTQKANDEGIELQQALHKFLEVANNSKYLIGHNIGFDINVIGSEILRKGLDNILPEYAVIDTKDESTDYCALPGGRGGKFKWPTLEELHLKLFRKGFGEAHNACADVEANTRAFFELCRIGVIKRNDIAITDATMLHLSEIASQILNTVQQRSDLGKSSDAGSDMISVSAAPSVNESIAFSHLHCHSQFSLVPSITNIKDLVNTAKEYGMSAIALTDHGNLYGAFKFVDAAVKAGIKPILGCEFYLCRNHLDKKNKDTGYTQVLISKNKNGYKNLSKLSSFALIHGMYYVPRIDRDLLVQYKQGLIATTGSLTAEIPSLILNEGEIKAEEAFLWWKEQFGDDFYIELQRHGLQEEDYVNGVLLKFAEKHQVKYFASNNTYYSKQKGSVAHDIMLCVRDGEKQSTEIGKGKGFRFGFPNDQYYIKSQDEMRKLFSDLPLAIATTNEIVEKVESYKLKRDVLLPDFEIPKVLLEENQQESQAAFERSIERKKVEWEKSLVSADEIEKQKTSLYNIAEQNAYLRYLTYKGAKNRYSEITPEIKERIDFELETVEKMGFPGYFLIVADFIEKAREMGVSVGPGRGSAAGSAIAYCTGITNVDPIKYNLLFERFLNPDRISMPDIDIDFDDRGRGKVMDYVVNKYGKKRVAQIITYGTMAAKSAIRDCSRVLDLHLSEADSLAKSFPDNPKATIKKILAKGGIDADLLEEMDADQKLAAENMRKMSEGTDLKAQVLREAAEVEGCMRNTGVHACGVIITPEDMEEIVPVTTAKDSEFLLTQYDNSVAEEAGLLKMDFLGLNTLTIINEAINLVRARHGINIVADDIPLDDPTTYALFQRGETVGVFQFESPGMQKYMKDLRPDKFDDLIAMNALYRPGPIEYIPNFIKRKHGEEEITYDTDGMDEYLQDTYGITVYQEQVMLLSRKLANFTKGDADTLRKAMGKKDRATLDKLKPKFLEGAISNGHKKERLEKIWTDWEAFASYAFNKSHATCYAYIAFHTAYLKANYPAEYMAAVLTEDMANIKNLTFYLDECTRMGLKVLGPDVNESKLTFSVNKDGNIRFGMAAVKGVGEAAVYAIIEEYKNNGNYSSIFDFTKRVSHRSVNKKSIENLAYTGAFDSFADIHRAQYFYSEADGQLFLEKAIKYGAAHQANINSSQQSLFGEESAVEMPQPIIPKCEPWPNLHQLKFEKELMGIYVSGHPLDDYKIEMNNFCNTTLDKLGDLSLLKGRDISIGGVVSEVFNGLTKNGAPWGRFTLEDYNGSYQFALFGEDYPNFKKWMNPGWFLYVKAKAQSHKWDKEKLELKISNIQLLSEIKESLVKGITIEIPLHELNTEVANSLIDLFVTAPEGGCNVKIVVIDNTEKIKIEMPSKKLKIDLTNDITERLDKMRELRYTLNQS